MEKRNSTGLTVLEGRRFAWTLATAFTVIGVLAEWRGRERLAAMLLVIGAIFVLAGLIAPTRLGPIERAWMGLAQVISKVTTPIFMGVVYFLVLTPTGLLRRAFSRNALSRDKSSETFWIHRKHIDREAVRHRMERQF